jgi:Ulp1 family protease
MYFLDSHGIHQEFTIQFAQVPKLNLYDCGIYVLHFTRCIFQGMDVNAFAFGHEEVYAFRTEIGKLLMKQPHDE